jgi:hypothetical protein
VYTKEPTHTVQEAALCVVMLLVCCFRVSTLTEKCVVLWSWKRQGGEWGF